jgi:putative ABC transport system permease protein
MRLLGWLARRALGLTLRLHPRADRRAFASEIETDLVLLTRRRARERGSRAAARLALRILFDVAASGMRTRGRSALRAAHRARALDGRRTMTRGIRILDALRGDLRDAWRSLLRTPGATLAAVLLLALGVGANAAVSAALRATLWAELDAPEPERLVVPRLTLLGPGATEPAMFRWSHPKYRVLRESAGRLVDPVAGYATRTVTVTGAGDAFRAEMQIADPAYFELLGAQPVMGQVYSDASVVAEPLVALLSHSLWRTRFGSDPAILGRRILVNARPVSVIGVLPQGFHGLGGEDGVWVPFEAAPSLLHPRQLQWAQAHWLNVLGRLREDAEWGEAREQMRAIGKAVAAAHPDEGSTAVMGADLVPLSEVRRNADAERAVRLLSAAAGAVLLIACANLALLFLGRGTRRMRDASIRQALGAGRWRVVRGVLVEAWLLASLGALAGLGVATLGGRWIAAAWPEHFVMGAAGVRYAAVEPPGLDAFTLGAALALAWFAALLFGIVPAWRVSGSAASPALRGTGGRSGGRAVGALGGRDVLVATQVALTLTLLAATGLLIQSLVRLDGVATGVEAPEQVLSARYDLGRSAAGADDPVAFHRRLVERLAALPGVRSVAVASASPFAGHTWITAVRRIDGRPDFAEAERPAIGIAAVDDSYFETLGVGLVAGRGFDSRDRRDGLPVAVLSRSAALGLFGDEAPIGRRLAMGIGLTPSDSDAMAEVIGVVEDVLYERPERGVFPDVYVSVRQEPFGDAVLLVRSTGAPEALAGAVRRTFSALDPDVPLWGTATLDHLRRDGVGDRRVLSVLLAAFALVGLALASLGTYGAISCWVDARRRELGLRLALGARAGQLVGLVLGRGLRTLALGTLLGLAGALAGGRLLRGVLFEVEPRDPVTLTAAATLLVAVGIAACWLPARRAARTDPNEVLRAS